MSNKKKKKQQPKIAPPSPRQRVVGVYLTLMFSVFPVFCTDGFFNIRHDRYYFFAALSLTLLAFWVLTLLAGDRKNAIGKITVTDWAMLGFLGVCILSTVFSIEPVKALWGTGGRNNGLFLMAIYVGIYFVVSRYGKPGNVAFAALGVISVFVSLVAILNFFSLDPLKMLEPLSAGEKKIFFSTIGNKNLLSGYLCITLPVLTVLYVEDNPKWLRILALICSVPGFSALLTADSDSGFLGLGALIAVYLILYSRQPKKLKRLLLVLTVMLLSARLLDPILTFTELKNKRMGAMQQFFVFSVPGLGLILLLAALTVFLHFLNKKKPDLELPKWLPTALFAALGTGLLAITIAVIYLTVNRDIPVQGIWWHFRLDDHWGTNRGYMWRRSMDIFRDFNLWRKLFGSGPDTFYYVFSPYFEELKNYWMSSTNAAHNEYLNYLITVGILGVSAYCTALVSGVVRCFRKAKEEPMATVYCAAVICYAVQALVSIAQPITTPLLILFLALCAGAANPQKTA